MKGLASKISVPEQVLFRNLGGEAVLLELDTGQYFGLDETGSRMWELLAAHGDPQRVLDELLREFDVTREQLSDDLADFVQRLSERGLVRLDES